MKLSRLEAIFPTFALLLACAAAWFVPQVFVPLKAAIVPPRYHCPGSRSMVITFQRPVFRKSTSALPEAASSRPARAFWRRFPPHSTGQADSQ